MPLYRAYNPNAKAGSHNYTVNSAEQTNLISVGWNDEGIAWNGIAGGSSAASTPVSKPSTGGQYYKSDNWTIPAPGMVFISKSGKSYTRVTNPGNYSYVTWAGQPSGAGNGNAQFIIADLYE
ncbi:hypothetical protein OfM2_08160 [Lactovum odontotermitis]